MLTVAAVLLGPLWCAWGADQRQGQGVPAWMKKSSRFPGYALRRPKGAAPATLEQAGIAAPKPTDDEEGPSAADGGEGGQDRPPSPASAPDRLPSELLNLVTVPIAAVAYGLAEREDEDDARGENWILPPSVDALMGEESADGDSGGDDDLGFELERSEDKEERSGWGWLEDARRKVEQEEEAKRREDEERDEAQAKRARSVSLGELAVQGDTRRQRAEPVIGGVVVRDKSWDAMKPVVNVPAANVPITGGDRGAGAGNPLQNLGGLENVVFGENPATRSQSPPVKPWTFDAPTIPSAVIRLPRHGGGGASDGVAPGSVLRPSSAAPSVAPRSLGGFGLQNDNPVVPSP